MPPRLSPLAGALDESEALGRSARWRMQRCRRRGKNRIRRDNVDAATLLDEALAIFGPRRLLFASDWPMMVRFADYRAWVDAVETLLARHHLSAAETDAVFGRNALDAHPRLKRSHTVNRNLEATS